MASLKSPFVSFQVEPNRVDRLDTVHCVIGMSFFFFLQFFSRPFVLFELLIAEQKKRKSSSSS